MKPYVCAVFLVNDTPPRQRFHLVDKLINAGEFNAHVRPARAVRAYYSDDEIRITRTVRCPLRMRTE